MASSCCKTAFFVIAILAGLARLTDDAKAMDVGQCFNIQDTEQKKRLNAYMTAEKLHFMVYANEKIIRTDQPVAEEVFEEGRIATGSDDGSVGYILHTTNTPINSSAPQSTAFKQICVSLKLEKVQLSDASKPGVREINQIAGDRRIEEQQCNALKIQQGRACGYHNDVLATADHNDLRVMFQGVDTNGRKNSDKSADVVVTILGNTTAHTGVFAFSSQQGAFSPETTFTWADYSDYARRRIALDGG